MASSTYLNYCITVTNESLLYATAAYARLEGPFRFFHLVRMRIAHGTLACSRPSAVPRVPNEVWEVIRHKLVDMELESAEHDWVSQLLCDHCYMCDCCAPRRSKTWSDLWVNEKDCDSCMDSTINQNGTAEPAVARACRAILRKYGLCMPSTQFLQGAIEHGATDSPFSPNSKPESLVIIALPAAGAKSADMREEQPCYPTPFVSQDKYFNDGVWNVSFDLPANADDRFRALVRDYHLDVVDIHDGTLALAGASAAKAGPELARRVEPVKSVRAIQPRWKLFTTVVFDW